LGLATVGLVGIDLWRASTVATTATVAAVVVVVAAVVTLALRSD
jgi:hypothetical protein